MTKPAARCSRPCMPPSGAPGLQIAVFVDWHRAQRGLIGKAASAGNAALYAEMARRLGPGVPIYGVPVQTREWMGVMHLKGFVIDDRVLYSGASLNDVYLHRGDRYRLDRYHLIESRPLADSMAALMTRSAEGECGGVCGRIASAAETRSLRARSVSFRRLAGDSRYPTVSGRIGEGRGGDHAAARLRCARQSAQCDDSAVIQRARRHLLLFTPYFNLPGAVRGPSKRKAPAGLPGDDRRRRQDRQRFLHCPGRAFHDDWRAALPLRSQPAPLLQAHQDAVDQDLLELHLWRHDPHSFHLKGLLVDDDYALLTGSNLNPRAWRLDLENGLLIHDPQGCLREPARGRTRTHPAHARRLDHHSALEALDSYPAPVQRILKRLTRTRADRLLNQVL
jgi:CDP-diacylglycerol--serine O-phosphatidyltransferase